MPIVNFGDQMPTGPHAHRYPATKPQMKYIDQLSIDLQFDTKRRNAHITSIVGRQINHLDNLTLAEASQVIETFKEWKENQES